MPDVRVWERGEDPWHESIPESSSPHLPSRVCHPRRTCTSVALYLQEPRQCPTAPPTYPVYLCATTCTSSSPKSTYSNSTLNIWRTIRIFLNFYIFNIRYANKRLQAYCKLSAWLPQILCFKFLLTMLSCHNSFMCVSPGPHMWS